MVEKEEKKRQKKKEEKKEKKKNEKEREGKENGQSEEKDPDEANRREEKVLGIEEIVKEMVERAMRVEKGMEGKKDKSKTDKEKEGEDEKKGQGEDEKEDKEKIAKDIRRLCRIYLKVMHELRDDRTR